MRTPKKKRLKTTSRYIYETLFMEGRDSDIIVSALSRDWKLHKLYLCQSPYFASMFNGNWRESNMDHIDITIVDPNISLDSMNVTLGSLYQDEISVEPAEVIPILATASLFQMDGLADQCANIMEETVNIETATKYYETGVFYGSSRIQDSCIAWLKVNLLSHLPEHPAKLRQVPVDLMQRLVTNSGLFVMQTEFSVYVLLRLWIYLIFHPNWDGSPQDAVMSSHKFFQERVKRDKHFFLETEEGAPYAKVFKSLRFNHLVNHHMDMDMLLKDRIIPEMWTSKVYRHQWQLLLRADQGVDRGPQSMTDSEFEKLCLRCGRTLNSGGQPHMWRWTGFNMGLDLIITFDNYVISMKRSLNASGNAEHEALLSNHKKRHIFYRVSVVSCNAQKQVTYEANSGIKSLTLGRNQTYELLQINKKKANFPLLLSFNFAVTTPMSVKES